MGRTMTRNGLGLVVSLGFVALLCGPSRAWVPTLPQVFLVLLAAALTAVGYVRLRRRARTP